MCVIQITYDFIVKWEVNKKYYKNKYDQNEIDKKKKIHVTKAHQQL